MNNFRPGTLSINDHPRLGYYFWSMSLLWTCEALREQIKYILFSVQVYTPAQSLFNIFANYLLFIYWKKIFLLLIFITSRSFYLPLILRNLWVFAFAIIIAFNSIHSVHAITFPCAPFQVKFTHFFKTVTSTIFFAFGSYLAGSLFLENLTCKGRRLRIVVNDLLIVSIGTRYDWPFLHLHLVFEIRFEKHG